MTTKSDIPRTLGKSSPARPVIRSDLATSDVPTEDQPSGEEQGVVELKSNPTVRFAEPITEPSSATERHIDLDDPHHVRADPSLVSGATIKPTAHVRRLDDTRPRGVFGLISPGKRPIPRCGPELDGPHVLIVGGFMTDSVVPRVVRYLEDCLRVENIKIDCVTTNRLFWRIWSVGDLGLDKLGTASESLLLRALCATVIDKPSPHRESA